MVCSGDRGGRTGTVETLLLGVSIVRQRPEFRSIVRHCGLSPRPAVGISSPTAGTLSPKRLERVTTCAEKSVSRAVIAAASSL